MGCEKKGKKREGREKLSHCCDRASWRRKVGWAKLGSGEKERRKKN
jgi:hypothetical protein